MFLRYVFPPHPVGFIPKEKLRGYVDGINPVSGKPLMPEMVEALTKPLTEEEKNPIIEKRPKRPRLLPPDTEENLYRLFIENGWTDGNPLFCRQQNGSRNVDRYRSRSPGSYWQNVRYHSSGAPQGTVEKWL